MILYLFVNFHHFIIFELKVSIFDTFVQGGINTSVKYGGIYVKSLNEKGAAEGDGRTQIGEWQRVFSLHLVHKPKHLYKLVTSLSGVGGYAESQ